MNSVVTWTGEFVQSNLGITLRSDPDRSVMPLKTIVGVALRRNPKRAQLLVSTVLAKHVPTLPGVAIAAGELLGLRVAHELDNEYFDVFLAERLAQILALDQAGVDVGDDLTALRSDLAAQKSHHPGVVTIGYAETATGLGQLVANTIGSYYIHSTRHTVHDAPSFAGFEEEHSHATKHQLYPTKGDWLTAGGTVVLVDDELSTGTTIINTITALNLTVPQSRWIVASLIDLRSSADRARFAECAAKLGTDISVVCLGAGSIDLPPNVLAASRETIDTFSTPPLPSRPHQGALEIIEPSVPNIRSARFGVDNGAGIDAARPIAQALMPSIGPGSVLVLGSEEFIALPMAVADHLQAENGGVRFSTTTRSPIAALDRPDYAIASAIAFTSHDDDEPRFVYNVLRGQRRPTTVIFMPEPGTDASRLTQAGGVVEALRAVVDHVIVVLLPESTPLHNEWTVRA